MSGGHFKYKQFQISDIADEIDRLITENGKKDTDGCGHEYPSDIIEKFKEAVHTLNRAADMAQRIDWLVSCDDGEDSFRSRWRDEVRPPFKDGLNASRENEIKNLNIMVSSLTQRIKKMNQMQGY